MTDNKLLTAAQIPAPIALSNMHYILRTKAQLNNKLVPQSISDEDTIKFYELLDSSKLGASYLIKIELYSVSLQRVLTHKTYSYRKMVGGWVIYDYSYKE